MANKNTGIYGHFGTFSATAQLPNTPGADVQTSELVSGDIASVAGVLYICTDATLGAAVWAAVGGGSTYVDAQPFTLSIQNLNGNFSQNGPTSYVRTAPAGQSTPQVGDLVRCSTRISGTLSAGQGVSSIITSPFPMPNVGIQCQTNGYVLSGSPLPPRGFLVLRQTSTQLDLSSAAFAAQTELIIDLTWSFFVGV